MQTKKLARPWIGALTFDRALASLALVVAIISLVVSYFAYVQPGQIRPLKPSGFGIIRGDGSFPSDMLVLPLEWENTSGSPILIRRPTLILHEVDRNGKETGNNYRFLLAGEYSEMSSNAFKDQYTYKSSFVVDSHSIPIKVLVFHYERWWDESNSNYRFRFKSSQQFKVWINYQPNLETRREVELFDLTIFPRVDELQNDRDRAWWDFFYLDSA